MNDLKIWRDEPGLLFDHHQLFVLILPLLIEQLLAVLVGIADTVMIAHVGEYAVSGVSLVDGTMLLFIQMFGALATGGAVIAGQYLGAKDREMACKASDQLVRFLTALSIVVMALIYLGKPFLLNVVFGSIAPDVYEAANTYLMITTASIPFLCLYNCCAAIFRMQGNSRVSMRVSLLMNIINVTGNAVLIYGLHWGPAGVAIPTLVSRMTAALVILVLLLRPEQPLHLHRSLRFSPDRSMIRRILNLGLPSGIESSIFQFGKIAILSLVSTFGTYAIAANAVGNTMSVFQTLPGQAIGLAITTVVARCVGAGDYKQARYYTKKIIAFIYLCFWVLNTLLFLLLPVVLWAYDLSPEATSAAKAILYIHGLGACAIWPLGFCLPHTLRSAGDTRFTLVVSVSAMIIFRVLFSYILGYVLDFGLPGVWFSMILDWIFRICFFIPRYLGDRWTRIRSI